MQGTTLIVQIEDAMMMVRVSSYNTASNASVRMAGNRGGFKHIQRVIVDQGNDARDLGDYEEGQQAGTKAADRSNARHALLNRSMPRLCKHSLREKQSR
jgi:hypothetical protein